MRVKLGSLNKLTFIYVCVVLFCFMPYEFCSVYLRFLPEKSHYLGALFIIVSAFLLIGRRCSLDKSVTRLAGIQFSGLLLVEFIHGNIAPVFGYAISICLALLLISLLASSEGVPSFFKKYNNWILLMAALGCITFFLILVFNLQPFSSAPDRGDGRMIYNYLLSFSKNNVGVDLGFRSSGFFDEPGAMGYWGLFALVFNRLFYKNYTFEVILSFFLIFTFSLGFILQLYLFFLLSVDLRDIKKLFVILGIPALIAVGILFTKDTDFDFVYQITYERIVDTFEEGKDNNSIVDVGNRAELSEKAKKAFLGSPLFGSKNVGDEYMQDNLYEPLAKYGIVGSVFVLSPYIWLVAWALKKRDKELLKMMGVLLVGFIHRPFHTQLLYFFVIYSMIILVKKLHYLKHPYVEPSQNLSHYSC